MSLLTQATEDGLLRLLFENADPRRFICGPDARSAGAPFWWTLLDPAGLEIFGTERPAHHAVGHHEWEVKSSASVGCVTVDGAVLRRTSNRAVVALLIFKAQHGSQGGCAMKRIVDTDNFGGDHPDERFVLWLMREEFAQRIANVLNEEAGPNPRRFFKVVEEDYVLSPGFEP